MSATIDEQFIDYIVKTIVGNPDAVSIKRTIDEKGVLLELTVDPEDLGRVIGKRGSGAQALRTLLRALGTKNEARYNLKIVDVGGERPPRPEREDRPQETSDQDEPVVEPAIQQEEGNLAEEQVAIRKEDQLPPTPALADNDDDDEDDEADKADSNLDRTRRELADLDDLDI